MRIHKVSQAHVARSKLPVAGGRLHPEAQPEGWQVAVCCLLLLGLLIACTQSLPEGAVSQAVQVRLAVGGQDQTLTTDATNVRELLEEAGIVLGDSDEVTPPSFTPLQEGMIVTVVRITESVEVITQSIPFERKTVRSEAMSADDPPVIVQAGKAGLQEVTVRLVYRDGLEAERWSTQVTVIEPAQDEIIMIGIGATRGNVRFAGTLAYISGGAAVVFRSSTAFPEQLQTVGPLDGRVFSLSPTGSHLLYTRAMTDATSFNNSLWLLSTEPGASPQPLNIENILWAGWNPAQAEPLQIAYTTATPTSQPPGWEANNDLWLGDIPVIGEEPFEPAQLVEAYPATYGWWGGNYAWSPNGRYLAYSYANEVGFIDLEAEEPDGQHVQLKRFIEYNTRADWVWVPTLSWSPDGRFLAFTLHNGEDRDAGVFDSWVVDVSQGVSGRFVSQAGMWAHLHWAPVEPDASEIFLNNSQIAFLRATDPLDSQRSSYTLWLMDQDGSNARQLYPPPGENSHFSREHQFMAWGPGGRDIAFIFNNALYILNLDTQEAHRITQDDAASRQPTWAPYGQAQLIAPDSSDDTPPAQAESTPTPTAGRSDDLFPEAP